MIIYTKNIFWKFGWEGEVQGGLFQNGNMSKFKCCYNKAHRERNVENLVKRKIPNTAAGGRIQSTGPRTTSP